ncbi:protein FAR1-RELATED SEQUENCE 5-like [Abrus precatorius]|uniref:Protein FAR1-RELATED SEQUENCE 5-like n=1 Tax=Abrus precatorius TaxID=3816 RepID=A0A8B8MI07_ABRPR|nr:protein FAR1-RELATED SEQUENCE 5-like [Abrus precatorius]
MCDRWKPGVDLEFESVDEAWEFWSEYGRRKGFGIRKQYFNKRKNGAITSYKYVCCKEGLWKGDKRDSQVVKHRAETRTNCYARIGVSLGKNKNFVIHEFVEEHNHPLQVLEITHMSVSHRKITLVQAFEIGITESFDLQQKSSYQLATTLVGNKVNVGYTRLDAKNYLNVRRQ